MAKASNYTSKQPDENGVIHWSEEENKIWSELVARQLACIEGKACDEYLAGLKKINLPTDRIPQLEEFDYLQEPDIFHEIFGHCAMLTNPAFAEFTHKYGQLGYAAEKKDRVYLARLYWFTVEFGLMQTEQGLRIYGGGILSSPGETQYVYSDKPEINAMNVLDVLRTPYRIDIMQPVYYTINSINDLFDISQMDIMSLVSKAKELGLHEPKFPPKEKLAS